MKNNITALPVCSTGPMHHEIVPLPLNLFLPQFSCWPFSETWKRSVPFIPTGFCASVISSSGHICLTSEGRRQFQIRLYLQSFIKRAFSLVCIPHSTILSMLRKQFNYTRQICLAQKNIWTWRYFTELYKPGVLKRNQLDFQGLCEIRSEYRRILIFNRNNSQKVCFQFFGS